MIDSWLIFNNRIPNTYNFSIVDICENPSVDNERIQTFCAEELSRAFWDIGFLKDILRKQGLTILERYIEDISNRRISTIHGDFGEVICTCILRDHDNHEVPIYKLRYRDKQDWCMRLTDILTYLQNADGIKLYFSEVKTHCSYDKNAGLDAYEGLKKASEETRPEILDFIQKRLFESAEYKKASIFIDIYFGKMPSTRYYFIFLAFDRRIWKEEVLENLNGISPSLTNLEARVVLINKLKDLIENSYKAISKVISAG